MSRQPITAHVRSKRMQIIRNLATELILHGHVTVIKSRKQDLEKMISQLINWTKKDTLHSKRLAISKLTNTGHDWPVTQRPLALLKTLAARYPNQNSGYVRSFLLPPRTGDSAVLFRIQLL